MTYDITEETTPGTKAHATALARAARHAEQRPLQPDVEALLRALVNGTQRDEALAPRLEIWRYAIRNGQGRLVATDAGRAYLMARGGAL
ncbi:hypothetical protein AB0K09_04210 [Streptomyces sp. NPDC049577]|uniref:hypothetical protein n=1 Tax=Streptomyces sp. NPDC049577 TaxID=3155153 RepID=UPI0034258E96